MFFFSPAWGTENKTEDSKKSGYRYIIDNYFSKSRSSGVYQDYSRSFTLYSGLSFYRESTVKFFKPFSSFVFGFNQKVKEIPHLGDVNLQVAIFSAKLEQQRAVLLEITPRISIPEVRTTFPLYIGLGAGFGFLSA